MAEISIRGLQKSYRKKEKGTMQEIPILKKIDLDIHDGEFMVLVGPSGCGKSTLLRCIAGLEDITGGELSLDGRRINDVAPKDRDVAMVFQSYALYPHWTVRDNMGFSLSIRKVAKEEIDAKVEEAARMLELSHLLDRFPKELSGGQRQRVAIGRAIVRKPKVFLFDEPLSNLDANLRAQMRLELKKLHQTLGVTMIYVTHDQIEAMTLADRICVLEGGYARQVDPPLTIYDRPVSRFVAEFIGSPPMNFLTVTKKNATLCGEGVSLTLNEPQQKLSLPQRMILGVRPHHLSLQGQGDASVKATVDVIETVGWDLHLHCLCDGKPIIAQVEAAKAKGVKPGDTIGFYVDPAEIRLFDESSEDALLGEQP